MAAPVFHLHPADGPPAQEAPNTAEILPPPSQPLDVVRVLLADADMHDGDHLLLRKWRGDHLRYEGPHWVVVDPEGVRKWLYLRLEHAQYMTRNKEGHDEARPWAPDKAKVDKLLDAMVAPTLLSRDVDAPSWLSTGESAAGLVPCLNGLVDVTTQEILPATPDYFGTVCVPLEFDPDAGEPVEWLQFLRTLWPQVDGQDAEEIRTLRQWFGYVLSGRMDLQKMLLIVGPPRCGKGTIGRILTSLVGEANATAVTLAGFGTNFGLETSIGKSLIVVGDARLRSDGQETVVERLLSISGQDRLTLDRKNLTAWSGTLGTRIMVMSNDLPKFGDASGAIASRFVILRLTESFLGREDHKLEGRLRQELGAILKWALDGLVDLNEAGRLHETPTHLSSMREMYDLVSPITAFVDDACERDSTATVPFADIYREYEKWCGENHRGQTNTARFSADLRSRYPGIKTDYRPRDSEGRKMPRHIKGLRISAEWANRVRPGTDGWLGAR